MMKFVSYWALVGLLMPLLIVGIGWFHVNAFEWPYFLLAVWPSAFLLMAVHEPGQTVWSILVFIISLAANVVFYSAVGAGVWFCHRLSKAKNHE